MRDYDRRTEGFTEQDSKVAGLAHEAGKGCVIAVNKWDAVEEDGRTMQEYRKKLEVDFSFMAYARWFSSPPRQASGWISCLS